MMVQNADEPAPLASDDTPAFGTTTTTTTSTATTTTAMTTTTNKTADASCQTTPIDEDKPVTDQMSTHTISDDIRQDGAESIPPASAAASSGASEEEAPAAAPPACDQTVGSRTGLRVPRRRKRKRGPRSSSEKWSVEEWIHAASAANSDTTEKTPAEPSVPARKITTGSDGVVRLKKEKPGRTPRSGSESVPVTGQLDRESSGVDCGSSGKKPCVEETIPGFKNLSISDKEVASCAGYGRQDAGPTVCRPKITTGSDGVVRLIKRKPGRPPVSKTVKGREDASLSGVDTEKKRSVEESVSVGPVATGVSTSDNVSHAKSGSGVEGKKVPVCRKRKRRQPTTTAAHQNEQAVVTEAPDFVASFSRQTVTAGQESVGASPPVKKRRGRPPGSRNKHSNTVTSPHKLTSASGGAAKKAADCEKKKTATKNAAVAPAQQSRKTHADAVKTFDAKFARMSSEGFAKDPVNPFAHLFDDRVPAAAAGKETTRPAMRFWQSSSVVNIAPAPPPSAEGQTSTGGSSSNTESSSTGNSGSGCRVGLAASEWKPVVAKKSVVAEKLSLDKQPTLTASTTSSASSRDDVWPSKTDQPASESTQNQLPVVEMEEQWSDVEPMTPPTVPAPFSEQRTVNTDERPDKEPQRHKDGADQGQGHHHSASKRHKVHKGKDADGQGEGEGQSHGHHRHHSASKHPLKMIIKPGKCQVVRVETPDPGDRDNGDGATSGTGEKPKVNVGSSTESATTRLPSSNPLNSEDSKSNRGSQKSAHHRHHHHHHGERDRSASKPKLSSSVFSSESVATRPSSSNPVNSGSGRSEPGSQRSTHQSASRPKSSNFSLSSVRSRSSSECSKIFGAVQRHERSRPDQWQRQRQPALGAQYLIDRFMAASSTERAQVLETWLPKLRDSESKRLSKLRNLEVTSNPLERKRLV